MINTIEFGGVKYPSFQAEGFSAQFILPYAQKICTGVGYDVGCNRKEWALPGSIPIDPNIDNRFDALNLPADTFGKVNYIFSSHCLEHIVEDWYNVLQYWVSNLKEGGVLFLYLPDYSQVYWRPWNNRKHKHVFTPEVIYDTFKALGLKNVFVSGVDLNNSFATMGEV